jgi:hypothetical protein
MTVKWIDDNTSISDNILAYCKKNNIHTRNNYFGQLEGLFEGNWYKFYSFVDKDTIYFMPDIEN